MRLAFCSLTLFYPLFSILSLQAAADAVLFAEGLSGVEEVLSEVEDLLLEDSLLEDSLALLLLSPSPFADFSALLPLRP